MGCHEEESVCYLECIVCYHKCVITSCSPFVRQRERMQLSYASTVLMTWISVFESHIPIWYHAKLKKRKKIHETDRIYSMRTIGSRRQQNM